MYAYTTARRRYSKCMLSDVSSACCAANLKPTLAMQAQILRVLESTPAAFCAEPQTELVSPKYAHMKHVRF